MADGGPDSIVFARQLDHFPVRGGVDPHRDHPRHARSRGLRNDLGRIAQLFQMEMGIYEDAISSSTGSSRLNSATGSGSLRPASSCEGTHLLIDSYSPVMIR